MIFFSFILFLLIFLAIGIASIAYSRKTTEDYLIAGKTVPPSLVGLSAIATNNSGFMFIGMIGTTYAMGLASIWLMIGWIIGDLIASLLAVTPIQKASRQENIHSFGGLLAHWHGTDYRRLRAVVGIMTVLLLTVYAAAQLKAGSKAAQALLDWPPEMGIFISAAIILVYSFAGGIRASIWTDVAQSVVMLVGMLLLMVVGVQFLGGAGEVWTRLQGVEPGYMHLFPDLDGLHVLLFILGWVFGGFAVIGQPHVVIRFMSLDRVEHVNRMRLYYYFWFTLFYGATIVVGLLARLILPEVEGFDPELALPGMASALLPQFLVGLILAAMFAATMSTADSLILACSASVTRDIAQGTSHSLFGTKAATFAILVVAAMIALSNNKTVFALVLDAWGMLASAFAPLIVVYALGQKVGEGWAIAMAAVGLLVFLGWNQAGLGGMIYSVGPGMLAGLAVYGLGAMAMPKSEASR